MSVKKKEERQRSWATVIYLDSAPQDWLSLLAEMVVPCFVSPYHDSDVNPTGEIKKPHYHILFNFEGNKSVQQMREIIDVIGGVGLERVKTVRGYARYLCHLDNPEKVQYSVDDVKQFGGLDYMATIGLAVDKYKAIKEMMAYCREENIHSYARLLEYAGEHEMGWFRVLCDNGTVVIKEYLKSKTWQAEKESKLVVNPQTGEVFE